MRISGTELSSVNFDYTTIKTLLRTASLINNHHPTSRVKPEYGYPTFPLTAKVVYSKGRTFKNL